MLSGIIRVLLHLRRDVLHEPLGHLKVSTARPSGSCLLLSLAVCKGGLLSPCHSCTAGHLHFVLELIYPRFRLSQETSWPFYGSHKPWRSQEPSSKSQPLVSWHLPFPCRVASYKLHTLEVLSSRTPAWLSHHDSQLAVFLPWPFSPLCFLIPNCMFPILGSFLTKWN